MTFIGEIIPYIQVVLSVLLIGAILLQRSEAGLGAGFGADSFNSNIYTRRGFEKFLFIGTIVIAIAFAASTLVALFLVK